MITGSYGPEGSLKETFALLKWRIILHLDRSEDVLEDVVSEDPELPACLPDDPVGRVRFEDRRVVPRRVPLELRVHVLELKANEGHIGVTVDNLQCDLPLAPLGDLLDVIVGDLHGVDGMRLVLVGQSIHDIQSFVLYVGLHEKENECARSLHNLMGRNIHSLSHYNVCNSCELRSSYGSKTESTVNYLGGILEMFYSEFVGDLNLKNIRIVINNSSLANCLDVGKDQTTF